MALILGMTRGELGLVIFLFALIWGAGVLPGIGERLGARWGKKRERG
jgi:hypothetical protein